MRVVEDTLGHPRPHAQTDSLHAVQGGARQSAGAVLVDTVKEGYKPTKSAGLAMLYSAIIPGGGQVYNHSYWKVPVILGFGIYFVTEWLSNNRSYLDYRSRYSASLATVANDRFKQLRDFYRDQRDAFAWYYLIMYVINIADAYVDASLYDFDVGGNLSLRLMPGEYGGVHQGVRLGMTLGF